ncbi:MAG: hypothetical protein Q4B70_07465, partial [Lachnospiraceae bacterium]|nr:hypothetical protein [Lachnospiraceae bacterium]
MKDTISLIKQLLIYFFREYAPLRMFEIAADDIAVFGMANAPILEGVQQCHEFMSRDFFEEYKKYTISFLEEKVLGENAAAVVFSLSAGNTSINYLLSGTSKMDGNHRKLAMLHFSMVSPEPIATFFSTQEKRKKEHERQMFLSNTVPGGV